MSRQAPLTTNPASVPQVTNKSSDGNPLILIVEDHEDTRFLLCYVMEQCGFRVVEALDGAEAVQVAEQSLPDLILMDTNLPRVDGLMATRSIRSVAKLRNVPIIFLSGHAQPEARATALAMGGSEYFVKPLNLMELESAVKAQLADNGRTGIEFHSLYKEQIAS